MQGVGHDEQDGGDVNDEDEAPGWYLPASLIIAEADCLVPVQSYPHQAQAGDVDTGSLMNTGLLKITHSAVFPLKMDKCLI